MGAQPKYKNRVVKIIPKNHIHYLEPVFSPSEARASPKKRKNKSKKKNFSHTEFSEFSIIKTRHTFTLKLIFFLFLYYGKAALRA